MTDSFFTEDPNGLFRPTSHTRGPWNPSACHAGPPTALLARALEHTLPGQRLCRLQVDLPRPIPFAGFRIESDIQRQGRTLSLTRARLLDSAGQLIATAAGLHLSTLPEDRQLDLHNERISIGTPDAAEPGPFAIYPLHDQDSFAGDGVQLRYPPGDTAAPGPTRVWMKTVPLLPDETPSPFQRICPLADCGNAFSRNAEPWEVAFMNADLSIVLFREPRGEWLGSASTSYWENDGIGLAEAQLFDADGLVGRALQTLILQPA